MSKGKHAYNGKHSIKRNKVKNMNNSDNVILSKKKPIFIKFFIALFILILCIEGYLFLSNYDNEKPEISQIEEYDSSLAKSIDEPYRVEYLEFEKLDIIKDASNKFNVSAVIKNNEDISHEKVLLKINLFDINKNIITYLDCKLEKIEKKAKLTAFSQVKKDLYNCKYYTVNIE